MVECLLAKEDVASSSLVSRSIKKKVSRPSFLLEDDNTDKNGFFEVGSIDKTLLDKKIYLKLFRELVSIFSLINYFKLNEKTGL